MKIYFFSLRQISLLFLISFTLFSCSKDETDPISKPIEDPEETVTVLVYNTDNGATQIDLPNCLGYLYLDSDNNLKAYTPESSLTEWNISSIGEVKGIGNILTIPEKGWNNQSGIFSNTGYVAVNVNGIDNRVVYTRLFVENYIFNSDQEIIAASVKYHSPFNGSAKEISVTKVDGEDNQENYEYYRYYKVKPAISWSVDIDVDWSQVFVVSEDMFMVYLPKNIAEEERTATITISSEGLEDFSLALPQEGAKPIIILNYYGDFFRIQNTGENSLSFFSTADWTASINVDWCTISPEEGTEGEYNRLLINAIPNTNQEEREGILTISATNSSGTTNLEIRVIQDSADFQSGDGTENNPYLISTAKHLDNIRNYSSNTVHFKLLNDIDLSDYLASKEKGWKGILNFKGVLDGNGYCIKNIWNIKVDYENSYGFIYNNSGTIKNLGLEIAVGKTLSASLDNLGGLVGKNERSGKIEKCYVKGIIEGSIQYLGGLVGENNGIISSSYVEGTIIFNGASTNCLGGLVGRNLGEISNSYSIATIIINSNRWFKVGGLVGTGIGKIECCYMAGTFETKSDEFIYPITDSSNIIIENTYYDKSILGIELDDDMGKTTEQMKQQSTFQNWDFDNVWKIVEGVSYPTLR